MDQTELELNDVFMISSSSSLLPCKRNSYALADVIPTLHQRSEPWAMTKGRLGFLLLQLSNTFFRVLAVPNKAVFCNNPLLMANPSFASHASTL